MNFQVLSTFNGHGISHDFARLLISGSRLQSSLEFQEPWFWGMSLSRSTQRILLKQVLLEFIHVFGICRGDSSWIPVSQCEQWPVRMLITWNEMWYIGRGQFECQLWFPGKTPLDFARDRGRTEIVNLMTGNASGLHGWGPKHCNVTMV